VDLTFIVVVAHVLVVETQFCLLNIVPLLYKNVEAEIAPDIRKFVKPRTMDDWKVIAEDDRNELNPKFCKVPVRLLERISILCPVSVNPVTPPDTRKLVPAAVMRVS
jgi:hypothetical protein